MENPCSPQAGFNSVLCGMWTILFKGVWSTIWLLRIGVWSIFCFMGGAIKVFAGGEVWSIIMQVSTFSNWGVIHCLVCGGVVHCLACGGVVLLVLSVWSILQW